ncbi:MAG TPA: hypothetical protein PKL60_08180 [Anaerolineaceae bacterium]|nr:hypothetical protein [Anaerolineaceae bacterium]
MITISEYAHILEREQDIIHLQTEGLGDTDLLVQPANGGNCMEWTLGISPTDSRPSCAFWTRFRLSIYPT